MESRNKFIGTGGKQLENKIRLQSALEYSDLESHNPKIDDEMLSLRQNKIWLQSALKWNNLENDNSKLADEMISLPWIINVKSW